MRYKLTLLFLLTLDAYCLRVCKISTNKVFFYNDAFNRSRVLLILWNVHFLRCELNRVIDIGTLRAVLSFR